MANKVIISCAVTGAIHTPTMSEGLPITPDEIAEQSIAAAEAGAAIIHLHARDPKTGEPTPDPNVFMEFLPRIIITQAFKLTHINMLFLVFKIIKINFRNNRGFQISIFPDIKTVEILFPKLPAA